MSFLAPWFLSGIAAISLPLWIHLLRQYRTTPRPFSSLMFFERHVQSSVKHRRLRYLLLLTLRVALVVLMAVAFANPFLTRRGTVGRGRKLLVLAVDNSFSMRYGDSFSKAQQAAAMAVSSLKPGDRGQALAVDSQVHFLTEQTEDTEQLRSAIRALQPTDARSSYGEFSRTLRTIAEAARRPLEVHFFTDAQKSSLPPAFADLRLGNNTSLLVHSVASGNSPNWTLESVSAPSRVYSSEKVHLKAAVKGFNTPATQKMASLVIDGKVLETKQVTVPENGRATVEFAALQPPYGFHRGEVRIEPRDELPNDDRFPFVIERTDPNPVLFLHQAGRVRDLLYFQSALEAVANAGFIVEPLAVDQAANRPLSKYPFVVLSDTGALPQSLEDQLQAYVSAGGSLLITLGPGSVSSRIVPVFHEALLQSSDSPGPGERARIVAAIDSDYPPMRGADNLEGVQFYQAVRVEPGHSQVIAWLTGQTPLLLEKRYGEGRIVVFSSTFDNISNDFPLHPSFLPFVEQMAHYLARQRDEQANLAVESFVDLRTAKNQGAAADVIDPGGKHALSFKEASTGQSYKLDREGFYEIHLANGRQELLAVHADREESDLTAMPPETLALWSNTGRGSGAQPEGAGPGQSRAWSLWRYVLFAVLLVAIAESLIGLRYTSSEREGT